MPNKIPNDGDSKGSLFDFYFSKFEREYNDYRTCPPKSKEDRKKAKERFILNFGKAVNQAKSDTDWDKAVGSIDMLKVGCNFELRDLVLSKLTEGQNGKINEVRKAKRASVREAKEGIIPRPPFLQYKGDGVKTPYL